MTAPYVLYFLYWNAMNRAKISCLLGEWRKWSDSQKSVKRLVAKAVVPGWLLLSAGFALCMTLFHLVLTGDLGKYDFSGGIKLMILVLGCLPVLIWSLQFSWAQLYRGSFPLWRTVCLVGGTTLLLNLLLLYTYVWQEPSYRERDMLISLSEEHELDGKYVISDFSMGITLYNDLKPVMDYGKNYAKRLMETPDMLYFHYASAYPGMRSLLNSVFDDYDDYTLSQTALVPGTLQAEGVTRDFALYEVRPCVEVIRIERERYMQEQEDLQEKLKILEAESGTEAEQTELRQKIEEAYEQYVQNYCVFGDKIGMIAEPVKADIYGDVHGDICAPVYGNIYGDIHGSVKDVIHGDIYGNIYGQIKVEPEGTYHGFHWNEVNGE